MVTIVGNVKPEDVYSPPSGPEDNLDESVCFNFGLGEYLNQPGNDI